MAKNYGPKVDYLHELWDSIYPHDQLEAALSTQIWQLEIRLDQLRRKHPEQLGARAVLSCAVLDATAPVDWSPAEKTFCYFHVGPGIERRFWRPPYLNDVLTEGQVTDHYGWAAIAAGLASGQNARYAESLLKNTWIAPPLPNGPTRETFNTE